MLRWMLAAAIAINGANLWLILRILRRLPH
jgi:hypothetical protein